MPLIRSANFNLLVEVLVRVGLFAAFCYLETLPPFVRIILPAEMENNCKYPRHESYVPGGVMWAIVLAVPCILSFIAWAVCNDCNDALEILLTWSLAIGMTGFITDMGKLIVGRPRPDFFYRCFPDGVPTPDMQCTGDPDDVIEGRKSFPSGHSSLSFCSLGVCALWTCGRAGALGRRRGAAARLLLCAAPLLLAAAVALSRTCDYHHHWQDVLVGSLLGYGIAVLVYRQYYNPLTSEHCGVPYVVSSASTAKFVSGRPDVSPGRQGTGFESTPLLASGVKRRISNFRVI